MSFNISDNETTPAENQPAPPPAYAAEEIVQNTGILKWLFPVLSLALVASVTWYYTGKKDAGKIPEKAANPTTTGKQISTKPVDSSGSKTIAP